MKHTFILMCCLLGATLLYAQSVFTGRVYDAKTNTGLVGANVYIEDLKLTATTDSMGYFEFLELPAGSYTVSAKMVGYAMKQGIYSLKGTVNQDIKMEAYDYEIDEVVVTGQMRATAITQTPQAITEVSSDYLAHNASTNIVDAIAKVPGLSAITNGQSIAKPVIRGLGYNRVVTVNDGVRQEGQQWGDEFGIEVDPNSVNRVEILKGPASLVYGSDAVSGVVNFLPESPVAKGEIKGHINGAYQTNNGLMNAGGFLAGNVNNITFDARVNNTLAHAYQNKDDGYVFNTQFNNFNAAGSVGLLGKWGYSQLHASYFELRTGIAEGAKDEEGFFMKSAIDEHGDKIEVRATDQELRSYTPFVINQLVKHSKLVWDNSISIGESRIVAKVGYQQNSRQENNDITRANTSIISYLLNTVTYDLRYLSPTWDGFNFSAGVSGMYQNSKNKGILLLIPQYNLFDIGGYAIANKTINKLSLSAGVRYDSRKFKGQDNYVNGDGQEVSASTPDAIHRFTAYNSDFNGVSASIGGALQLSNNAYIKLNVARGFRAPNVAESGSNGIKDGTVVYEIGNPKLKPENSLQIDFTPGIRSKDVTAELSLFYNRINNFIYVNQQFKPDGTPISDTSTPGFGPAPVFSYQQNDAVLMGGEAVIDLHPSGLKWFDWYNSFSVVNAQLQNVSADSLKAIPFTPPARLRSEIILSNKHPHKGLQNYYFKFGVFHSFEQTDVYQLVSVYKEIEGKLPNTPAYTLLNAGFGTDFVSHGKTVMSLAVSIDNLADVSYVDYLSRYRYYTNEVKGNKRVGIYNMGRNISFKVNVPLQFSSGHHSTVEHGNAAPKPTRDDE